ncbi:MAG TPA: PAS domain S-box protein, partial [Thermoanaerobaculia bacterium]
MSCLTPATRSFLDGVYRTLFEQHPQPMWVYDTERLTFLAVNAAAIRHYGYSAEEFAGLRVTDIHTDLEPRFSRKRSERHRRKDGSELEVETTSTRVNVDGIAARLVNIEDVTERNRAERALRESKQRYRALVGDSYDAICLADSDGRIIYLNPTLHRMFGYDEEELLGQDGFALIHREDISRIEELRRELVARPGATVTFECRARQKSGEWRWLQGIAANLLDDPGVRALVLNYRDVTGRRRAELALRDDTRTAGAAEWIWTVDTEGVLLSSTDAVETILGYRPADIVGKPFHELYF